MSAADGDAAARAVRRSAAEMIALAVHELNNRLAVMRETIGLLEDLSRAGKAAAAGTARAHASLDEQVGRALNVVRALSGLGVALGDAASEFDAAAAAGDLVGLTERWARQRSLGLRLEAAAGLPRAAGDRGLFLCLAHRLLSRAGDGLAAGGTIALTVAADRGRIRVRLLPGGGPPGPGPDDDIDRELARRLGGELLREGGGAATIVLAMAR